MPKRKLNLSGPPTLTIEPSPRAGGGPGVSLTVTLDYGHKQSILTYHEVVDATSVLSRARELLKSHFLDLDEQLEPGRYATKQITIVRCRRRLLGPVYKVIDVRIKS